MIIDLATIPYYPCPNHYLGRKGKTPTHIIIHTTQGPTFQSTYNTFINPKSQVSAHYLIDQTGRVGQFVHDQDAAWHVGRANLFTIGIEHVGYVDNPKWVTWQMLERSISLTQALMKKWNIPAKNVIGHDSQLMRDWGNSHSDPGPYWGWGEFYARLG